MQPWETSEFKTLPMTIKFICCWKSLVQEFLSTIKLLGYGVISVSTTRGRLHESGNTVGRTSSSWWRQHPAIRESTELAMFSQQLLGRTRLNKPSSAFGKSLLKYTNNSRLQLSNIKQPPQVVTNLASICHLVYNFGSKKSGLIEFSHTGSHPQLVLVPSPLPHEIRWDTSYQFLLFSGGQSKGSHQL